MKKIITFTIIICLCFLAASCKKTQNTNSLNSISGTNLSNSLNSANDNNSASYNNLENSFSSEISSSLNNSVVENSTSQTSLSSASEINSSSASTQYTGKLSSDENLRALQNQTLSSLSLKFDKFYQMKYFADYKNNIATQTGFSSVSDIYAFSNQNLTNGITAPTMFSAKESSCFSAASNNGDKLCGRNYANYLTSPIMILEIPEATNRYASVNMVDLSYLGYSSTSFTSKDKSNLILSPFFAVDGMNSQGLVISVDFIASTNQTAQSGNLTNVTATSFIRTVLDEKANVSEVINYAKTVNMHVGIENFNCHFFVSDLSGRTVVIEYYNNAMTVYEKGATENAIDIDASFSFYLNAEANNNEPSVVATTAYNKLKLKNLTSSSKYILMDYNDIIKNQYTLRSVVYNKTAKEVTLALSPDYDYFYNFNVSTVNITKETIVLPEI